MNPLITPLPDAVPSDSPLANTVPVDEDLAEQATPGHGIPSQDPDPQAQVQLEPAEAEREVKSALIGGGVVAGAATGAAIGVAMAGPVGVLIGASLGAVAGAVGVLWGVPPPKTQTSPRIDWPAGTTPQGASCPTASRPSPTPNSSPPAALAA